MNGTKHHIMNYSQLNVGDESDHEKFEKEEEKLHLLMTLNEMELTESCENCHLLQDKKNTESLESIQNYAQRIKSFLGWEPEVEEKELESERDEINGTTGGNLAGSSSGSLAAGEEYNISDKETGCFGENFEGVGVISKSEADSKEDCKNEIKYMKDDEISISVVADKNLIKGTDLSNVCFVSNENLKMNPILSNGDIRDKKTSDINSASDKSESISLEDKKLNGNEDISAPESIKDVKLNNNNLRESTNETVDKYGNFEEDENKVCEPEIRNFEDDYFNFSDSKIDHGNEDSSLPSIDIIRDEDLCKKGALNGTSKQVFSKMSDFYLEGNLELIDGEKENESKIMGTSENLTSENSNCKDENNEINDTRSEESLDLDEQFSVDETLPKNYVKEIRRLSRGLVKEVIESARSSVHELYAGENFGSQSLENYERIKDNQELYFNNGIEPNNDALQFDKQALKANFDNNSGDKKHQAEQKLVTEDKDIFCGCGSFKPKWIQKYATPRAFLVIFSIIGIIHGCYYSYFVSILSTLEKRYAFKNKVSGILLLADEITPLVLGILVGYIGGRTHRPRLVAIGMFLSAACCLISGLPYLLYGISKNTSYFDENYKTGPKYCKTGINSTHCNIDERPPTLSVIGIFLLASFLKGFATLSYYTIGMSYMDDIIKRKNSPVYFAIAMALRLLGPLVGFLMSSGFLKYYENPLYDPGFGPEDPRWIGAWWIGFFLQGVLLIIFTIPIALFPRRLPGQRKIEKMADTASEDGLKEIFRGLVSAVKRLGKNPVFIVLIFNTTMKVYGNFGHAIMLPKYMENQFRLSAAEASLFSGAVSIVCIIISTMLGGFLIWKFRPSIKVILGGMMISELILCIGFLVLMIPRCQTSEMLHFGMDEEGLILRSVCNNNCDCSSSAFTPFCGADNKTLYFSPCYAGCTEEVTSSMLPNTKKKFSNCSCVDQREFEATITEGFCPDETCRNQMKIYLILLFALVTITNLFTVAGTMILLRSVHPSDKSVALGTFETFICLFGFIPFPVTYGALVDSACLVWEKSCGETGNCWFYDMDKYGYLVHGMSALFCALSVLCLITLYFLSSRIRNLYVEEDEKEEDKYVDIKLDTVSGSVTKL